MDNFQIETAQNVSISQNVAGLGERIVAYLIDGVIMVFYIIAVGLLLGGMHTSGGERWVFLLVLGLPVFLYFLVWESMWNGQTPGKAALQLRVVKLDGSTPVFSNYLLRWLLRIVDISLTSGSLAVVTILLNGKGQRLGDLAAGTTVISEVKKMGLHQTLLMTLPEDYQPTYQQARMLNDRDVQKIKNLYQEALKNSNHRVIRSLSSRVSELMQVTPKEKPVYFIKTVLKDYSYFTQA